MTSERTDIVERTDRRVGLIAWGAGIGVHLALLAVAAFLNVGWKYDVPEWVEMQFAAAKKAPARPAVRRRSPAPAKAKPQQPEKQSRMKISLPKRRMLEEETPLLRARQKRDFAADETAREALELRADQRKQEFELPRPADRGAGKSIAELENFDTGAKEILTDIPDFGKGVAVPFKIEGEAANRSVLSKVIPRYPPGLNQQAVVKLSFSVLPSGVVASVVPVLKGDAVLEKIAVEAFRQWRFNSLPAGAAPAIQRGTITFRFVIR